MTRGLLEPYSPEHNPIEKLWKELHANVTRNHKRVGETQAIAITPVFEISECLLSA